MQGSCADLRGGRSLTKKTCPSCLRHEIRLVLDVRGGLKSADPKCDFQSPIVFTSRQTLAREIRCFRVTWVRDIPPTRSRTTCCRSILRNASDMPPFQSSPPHNRQLVSGKPLCRTTRRKVIRDHPPITISGSDCSRSQAPEESSGYRRAAGNEQIIDVVAVEI